VAFGGATPVYYKMVIHFYKLGVDRATGPAKCRKQFRQSIR